MTSMVSEMENQLMSAAGTKAPSIWPILSILLYIPMTLDEPIRCETGRLRIMTFREAPLILTENPKKRTEATTIQSPAEK